MTFLRESFVVFRRQLRMNLRNPAWVIIGLMQPILYLLLFGPLLKPVTALLSRKVRSRAKRLGVRYSFLFMHADGAQLKTLAALYDAVTLRPVFDRTFDFHDTLDALTYVEQGKANGKIVITR